MPAHETVVVVAAHPDDEILGCGATIARLAEEGCSVHIAIVGEGITSRATQPKNAKPESLTRLHQHAKKAARIVGAEDVVLFRLPDNRLDTLPLLDIVKLI